MDDRVRFFEHKGKQILLLDFSDANAHQMQLLSSMCGSPWLSTGTSR